MIKLILSILVSTALFAASVDEFVDDFSAQLVATPPDGRGAMIQTLQQELGDHVTPFRLFKMSLGTIAGMRSQCRGLQTDDKRWLKALNALCSDIGHTCQEMCGSTFEASKEKFRKQLYNLVEHRMIVKVQWNGHFSEWKNRFLYPYVTDCPNPLQIDSSVTAVTGVWPAELPCPTDHDSLQDCWQRSRDSFDSKKCLLGSYISYKREKDKLFADDWVTPYKELACKALKVVEDHVYPSAVKEAVKESYLLGMLGYVLDVCYRQETLSQKDLDWLKAPSQCNASSYRRVLRRSLQ